MDLADAVTYHLVNTLGWPQLRPLQQAAIEPVRLGSNALLVAPTAGGKTEAAFLPLLSEMAEAPWQGLSVIYVTPLRALLNNLHPRLSTYAEWVGRRVGLWHGDVGQGDRSRILGDPPDVLLTTPESLEAMLVSTRVDHGFMFGGLQAVVVDELHAFAGDDRGWHLLAVLERLERLAGRPLQRVGMTATVGNPEEMLEWLTRGAGGEVVAPDSMAVADAGEPVAGSPPRGETAQHSSVDVDIALDYVGSEANAAKVIDLIHPGEKRLVFCRSRAQAEKVAAELRERGVLTVVSHSSLSADERRHAERTFAEAPECVVVATSTLELGVDIGDLDRVVQLDAPTTVASFLQRLGRAGRRLGTRRNMLFLATTDAGLLQSAALLRLWQSGFVEPVVPPPAPTHIAAQQLLALGLQERRYPLERWREWWPGLEWMQQARPVLQHLLDAGFLQFDAGFAAVGEASEARYGGRNFLELTSVFTAAPEFVVLSGREEVGAVSPMTLSMKIPAGAPRVLSLGGRGWQVTHVDWSRRRVFVVPTTGTGRSMWQGGTAQMGWEMAQSVNAVLAGAEPDVEMSQRAVSRLDVVRSDSQMPVAPAGGSVLQPASVGTMWWTYAGSAINAALAAALGRLGFQATPSPLRVSVGSRLGVEDVRRCEGELRLIAAALGDVGVGESAGEVGELAPPAGGGPSGMLAVEGVEGVEVVRGIVDDEAVRGLKFSELLPPALAAAALARRTWDVRGALSVVRGSAHVVA